MKKKNKIVYSLLLLYIATMHGTTTVFHRYLWANYNHFSGKLTTAHNWYSSLFSSHHSLYSYKGYLHFLFDTKQYVKITELIPSLDKKFEKDPEIQLLFVLALEKNKQTQEADSRLIKLNSSFKSNADIALRTTQAYVRRKEPENALSTIDTFLNNSPRKSNNFIFYYLKSQIHLQLSQLPEALSTVTVCLDMHPQFDKGWLLFATLQEQKGEIQKALQGYATFLELSGGNNTVEKHLFSLMLQHKTNSNHVPFHKSYFDWAVAFYQKKEYKSALLYINKYLTLQPHTYEALVLKLHIVAQLDHKKIADFMIEVLKTDPHNQAWPKNIYLLQHDGIDKEKIIATLQHISKKYPQNYWLPLYAADLCIRTQQTSQAIPFLEQAIQQSTDTLLNAKIYHQLGLLQYHVQHYDQMIINLEKGFALNNQCPHLNNTLAYYWATKGKNTQKALSFFDNVNEQYKNHPCFLDTQALIFYKQEQYNKAQEVLEQLPEHNNATILLHLAKTYYKANNKEKALALTKKIATCTMNQNEAQSLQKLQLLLAANE